MQNEMITGMEEFQFPTTNRTIDEISADIRISFRTGVSAFAQIGLDLGEVKQKIGHGGWLPYLRSQGISPSTADKYMRFAAEAQRDQRLTTIPYTAALALISLPEADREKVQEQDLEGKSAAEIKRLIAEVKKEKKRADDAERDAQEAQRANQTTAATLKSVMNQMNERPVVEKIVPPEDYEDLKDAVETLRAELAEAEEAAADAEDRAKMAVNDAQRAAMRQLDQDEAQDDGRPSLSDLISICNEFQSKVWATPFMQDTFRASSKEEISGYQLIVSGIKSWADRTLAAIQSATAPVPVEGVIIDAEP